MSHRLVSVATTGLEPKGNEACSTLPQFALHCTLRRGLCRAQDPVTSNRLSRWLGFADGSSLSHFTQEQIVLRKDDVEIGNSG